MRLPFPDHAYPVYGTDGTREIFLFGSPTRPLAVRPDPLGRDGPIRLSFGFEHERTTWASRIGGEYDGSSDEP